MSSKVIKLTWSEVAEMVRTELRKIIGRDILCVAKSDDDTGYAKDVAYDAKSQRARRRCRIACDAVL